MHSSPAYAMAYVEQAEGDHPADASAMPSLFPTLLPYLIAHLPLETSPSSSDNPLKLTVASNLPNLSVPYVKITKHVVCKRIKST